jgi:hypothetical protein
VRLVKEALEEMLWRDEEGGDLHYEYDHDEDKWVSRAFEGLKLSGAGAPREEGLARLGITAEEADAMEGGAESGCGWDEQCAGRTKPNPPRPYSFEQEG